MKVSNGYTHRWEKFFRLLARLLLALLIVSSNAQAGQPPSNTELIESPEDAIQKLKIDAGFGWGIFSGTIYNGNDNEVCYQEWSPWV